MKRTPHRRLILPAVAALALSATPVGFATAEPSPAPSPSPTASDPLTADYSDDFTLSELSADPIVDVAKPAPGAAVTDPAYGTRVYRATSAEDGSGRMRHEYSRRQAFNADESRYLAQDSTGHWHLYDGQTMKHAKVVEALAGDSEPLWHPSDPNTLYFTGRNGGMQWRSLNVESGKQEVVFDFTGKTPWPQATSFWTKGEGTLSADGRYLALMATTYDEATTSNKIFGLVTLDLQEKKIVGTLDASKFPKPHAFPDHISVSASGKYAVPSWLKKDGGTHAYTLDFKQSRGLADDSQHSDLAFGPNKEDLLIYADYSVGAIVSINLDTGEREELHTLYPASGEGYALHISGQAFDKPGWAVISTYHDFANYNTYPSPTLRAEYRKVWLLELKPGGRKLNVAHIRANEREVTGDAYFLEPQASASRDLSRIIFASNYGGGEVESYVVPLPEDVLD